MARLSAIDQVDRPDMQSSWTCLEHGDIYKIYTDKLLES